MAKLLQRPGASYIRFQAFSSQGRTFLVEAVWFTASQTEVKVTSTAQSPSPWRTHNKAFCAPGPWGPLWEVCAEAMEQFPWGWGRAGARGSPASSELGTELDTRDWGQLSCAET